MDIAQLIQTVAIYALPVLFAITVHEAAHGYAALHFGDPTAHALGRISLNPLKHIDPVGTIVMPLLLYFATAGAFLFGYAKPVPVNFGRLRNPKRDMIWVALAGPGANLLQALLWGVFGVVLLGLHVNEYICLKMCEAGVKINLVLFAFNLLPLPPLDGGRILVGLLPWRAASMLARLEPWGFFIVIALVLVGVVDTYWLHPVIAASQNLLALLLKPLAMLFG